ncbi:MAG: exodeoxyribonuclease VII small subunit, partial [Clostridia bacterium]
MKNTFEDDLKKLEEIGAKLEATDLSLDEAIAIYE